MNSKLKQFVAARLARRVYPVLLYRITVYYTVPGQMHALSDYLQTQSFLYDVLSLQVIKECDPEQQTYRVNPFDRRLYLCRRDRGWVWIEGGDENSVPGRAMPITEIFSCGFDR